MAEGNEIRQRIRIENEASEELRRVADDTQQLGEATQDAGQQASEAAQGQDEFAGAADRMGEAAGDAGREAGEQATAMHGLGQATGEASRETAEHADAQRDAADEIGDTTAEMETQGGAAGELGESVGGMALAWGAFTAIVGLVVAGFDEITEAAKRTAEATRDAGRASRDLINNLGADRGSETYRFTGTVAANEALDQRGRAGLIEAAARMTDLHPDMDDEELQRRISGLARLDRVTGLQGRQAVDLVQAFERRGEMSFEQATEASAHIATGPLEASDAQNLLQRGGMQALTMALAAAPESTDPARFVRQVPMIHQRLRDMDDEQREALGLEEGMGLIQSLQTMTRGIDEGRVDETAVVDALGGERSRDVIDPLLSVARSPDRLASARADLYDAGGIDQRMAELRSSSEYRAVERDNRRDLSEQVHDETSPRLARFGEAVEIMENQMRQTPGLSAVEGIPYVGGGMARGMAMLDPDLWWGEESEELRERMSQRQRETMRRRLTPDVLEGGEAGESRGGGQGEEPPLTQMLPTSTGADGPGGPASTSDAEAISPAEETEASRQATLADIARRREAWQRREAERASEAAETTPARNVEQADGIDEPEAAEPDTPPSAPAGDRRERSASPPDRDASSSAATTREEPPAIHAGDVPAAPRSYTRPASLAPADQASAGTTVINNNHYDNRVTIGTNYSRREDPAWADVEPPLGLG